MLRRDQRQGDEACGRPRMEANLRPSGRTGAPAGVEARRRPVAAVGRVHTGEQTEATLSDDLIRDLFDLTPAIRYVALARGREVVMRERPGLAAPSSSESDRYEELLVNPTLIELARRRGEIDCGGLRHLVVGYGRFHQLVVPTRDGHASVAFELEADPLASLPAVRDLLAAHGLAGERAD